MKIGLFTGSFDVFTNGHRDIVERALGLFDKVIIGIGINPSKKYLIPLKQRIETIRILMKIYERTNSAFARVEVCDFSGLAADFAYESGVTHLIKGIRDPNDFNYEQLLHEITISQHAGLETISLYGSAKYRHVSSSAAKELCRYQGLIADYVHLFVKEQLEWALNSQFIVGVVGEIAVGKSTLSDAIVTRMKSEGAFHFGRIDAHNIDLDKLVHDIYVRTEPVYVQIQKQIISDFNLPTNDGTVDRKVLGEIVFASSAALNHLNSILRVPIITRLRQVIRGKTGLILLNGSLLAEAGMLHLCNNNVIVVSRARSQQIQSLEARGLTEPQALRRINSQFHIVTKKKLIASAIDTDGHGQMLTINNNSTNVRELVKPVCDTLQLVINRRSYSTSY